MGRLYHGYVSHNQRVDGMKLWTSWSEVPFDDVIGRECSMKLPGNHPFRVQQFFKTNRDGSKVEDTQTTQKLNMPLFGVCVCIIWSSNGCLFDIPIKKRSLWTLPSELDIFNGRSSGSNKWRYVSTIFLAIFSGDIPWNLGLNNRPNIYGIGTSNQSVPEMTIDILPHPDLSGSKAAFTILLARCQS